MFKFTRISISILAFHLFLGSSWTFAQIKNPDFELARDTLISMPQDWKAKEVDGYDFLLTNEAFFSGYNSFCIKSATSNALYGFASFSQLLEFDVQSFKRIAISV